jgi:small subunit ribosomal protein S4
VDGKKASVPSHQLKPGQSISVCEGSKKLIKEVIEANPAPVAPNWMFANIEGLTTSMVNLPEREDLDQTIKEALIVEYYSR